MQRLLVIKMQVFPFLLLVACHQHKKIPKRTAITCTLLLSWTVSNYRCCKKCPKNDPKKKFTSTLLPSEVQLLPLKALQGLSLQQRLGLQLVWMKTNGLLKACRKLGNGDRNWGRLEDRNLLRITKVKLIPSSGPRIQVFWEQDSFERICDSGKVQKALTFCTQLLEQGNWQLLAVITPGTNVFLN